MAQQQSILKNELNKMLYNIRSYHIRREIEKTIKDVFNNNARRQIKKAKSKKSNKKCQQK